MNAPGRSEPIRDLEKAWPQAAKALHKIVYDYEAENATPRLERLKWIKKGREFWRGSHYTWFDSKTQEWTPVIPGGQSAESRSLPRYPLTRNIYRSYGLAFIAVLSTGRPTTLWLPNDWQDEMDVATAKAASDVALFFRRNQDMQAVLSYLCWYLFTDGAAAGYVRYVSDAEEFGTDEEPMMEQGSLPVCPGCATAYAGPTQPCPACGKTYPRPMDVMQPTPQTSKLTGAPLTKPVSRGQETLEIVSDLQLVKPWWAQKMKDMPWLTYSRLVHPSKLKAMYPELHDKLGKGGNDNTGSAAAQQERLLQTTLAQPAPVGYAPMSSRSQTELSQFRETWFRPWALEIIRDKGLREEMKQEFPKGLRVAHVGDICAEVEAESMDAHWVMMSAMPAEGQNSDGVGADTLPLQRRVNILDTMNIEAAEYAVPITLVDAGIIDEEALRERATIQGTVFGGVPRIGRSMSDAISVSAASGPSAVAMQMADADAGVNAQLASGMLPSVYGGDTGGNDTAHGIQIERDQALGRQGGFWRSMCQFLARCDRVAVEEFRNNRDEDVSFAVLGAGGVLDKRLIRLDALQGNLLAYSDPTEAMPTSVEAKGAALDGLVGTGNPAIEAIWNEPGNVEALVRYKGLAEEITVPGADLRSKELRIVQQLVDGTKPPMMAPVAVGPDGQPIAPPQIVAPGVPFDPNTDDPNITVSVIRSWTASDTGQQVQEENPEGYANVLARLNQALQVLVSQQAAAAAQEAQAGQSSPPAAEQKGSAAA